VLLPHPNDPFSNERDREKKRFNLIDNFGPSIVSAAIFKWKRKNIIISSGWIIYFLISVCYSSDVCILSKKQRSIKGGTIYPIAEVPPPYILGWQSRG
jgi:hypothetical protein